MESRASGQSSRVRVVALRVVVALLLLVGLAGFNLLLVFPLLSWLPEAAWVDVIGYPEADLPHLVHGFAIGLWYGVLMLCLAVQLRRPERSVAPLWVVAFIILSQIVYDLVIRDIGDPIWFLVYALCVLVVVLHPRRVVWPSGADWPGLLLVAAAAVPLAGHGWSQLRLQFGPEDPFGHVAENHFFTMAGLSGLVIVTAALGAMAVPGRLLVAWTSGAVAALFGVASLAHPGLASAWSTPWALAAIGWGVGYVALTVLRRRGQAAAVSDQPVRSSPLRR